MDKFRRDLLAKMAGGAAMLPLLGVGASSVEAASAQSKGASSQSGHDHSGAMAYRSGSEKIGMLVYPGMTALDMIGPQYILASMMGSTVDLVSKDGEMVMSDTGVGIMPTASFDTCPEELDLLFVPGSAQGALETMEDDETIAFVAERGKTAKRVTSVCTGSLILGRAGLLKGYKATGHWLTLDLLPLFGAEPVKDRYIIDRNRITGGGVSAGLDFGLAVVAELRGRPYAEAIQLLAEYAPEPPFNSGSPDTAPQQHVDMFSTMFVSFKERVKRIAG